MYDEYPSNPSNGESGDGELDDGELDLVSGGILGVVRKSSQADNNGMKVPKTMDRHSTFVTTLSNIENKIDSIQETIVQNLKG